MNIDPYSLIFILSSNYWFITRLIYEQRSDFHSIVYFICLHVKTLKSIINSIHGVYRTDHKFNIAHLALVIFYFCCIIFIFIVLRINFDFNIKTIKYLNQFSFKYMIYLMYVCINLDMYINIHFHIKFIYFFKNFLQIVWKQA